MNSPRMLDRQQKDRVASPRTTWETQTRPKGQAGRLMTPADSRGDRIRTCDLLNPYEAVRARTVAYASVPSILSH